MQGDNGDERVDVHPVEERGSESRRPTFNGHPDDRHCRRCRQPIRGRRRNGYCSNRCRLADRREARRRKQLELLATINTAVATIDAAVEKLREAVEVKTKFRSRSEEGQSHPSRRDNECGSQHGGL
jgi:predicted nucleic acid-binding Zn ribbon protein